MRKHDRWQLNERGKAAVGAKAAAAGCLSQEDHARLLGMSRTSYCNRLGNRWHKKATIKAFLRAAGIPDARHAKLIEPENLSAGPGHVPIAGSAFVGRNRDVREVISLLRSKQGTRSQRLVTLTGIGGIGKTRLAMAIGHRLMNGSIFSHGVWWVDLQSIGDSALLPTAFWQALRLEGQEANEPSLLRHLAGKQLLLIVDRCEELLETTGALLERILHHAPSVKVVATSRHAFGLPEEKVFPVEPLLLPEFCDEPQQLVSAIKSSESGRLLLDRLKYLDPGFAITPTNSRSIFALCRRTAGSPRAIQLIAGASGTTYRGHPEELERDLDEGKISGLYETVQWAYERLQPKEQRLFATLSVFVGGWDLDAARAVYEKSDKLLRLIGPLCDWNLIKRVPGGDRYRMLDTERAFARQKLQEIGEEHQVHRNHLAHYLILVLSARKGLRTSQGKSWLNRLDEETGNIREGIRFALEDGALDQGMKLAGFMWMFWSRRGMYEEGMSYCQRFLEQADSSRFPLAQAVCLEGIGHLMFARGNLKAALDYHRQSLALRAENKDEEGIAESLLQIARCELGQGDTFSGRRDAIESYCLWKRLGNRHGMASCMLQLGRCWRSLGNAAKALRMQYRALAWLQECGDDVGRAWHLCYLTSQLIELQRLEEAQQRTEEAKILFKEHGDLVGVAWCVMHTGLFAWRRGDNAHARHLLQDAEAMFTERAYEEGVGVTLIYLGQIALDEKHWAWAHGVLREALLLFKDLRRWATACWAVSQLVRCAVGAGEYQDAARLLGVFKRMRKDIQNKPFIADRPAFAQAIGETRAAFRAERVPVIPASRLLYKRRRVSLLRTVATAGIVNGLRRSTVLGQNRIQRG